MMLELKYQHVKDVISLRSSIFSDYFYTLMTNHNVRSIRNGWKVLIFYSYCEIVASHMSERGNIFRPILALLSFCFYSLFFASTVNVNETTVMVRLSSAAVVISMTYSVLLGTDYGEIMETHYTLAVSTILMMYTLFRFKFIITMMLSFIYILIFLSIGNHRMDYISRINFSDIVEPRLELERTHQSKMTDKRSFIVGQCILLFTICLTGTYLRFFNSIRRKSAFIKLAQNAEAKMKMQSAIKVQTYWIEAIMPLAVKDDYMKHSHSRDTFKLLYCKKFENVSILFADIVGFTEISASKTPSQLVSLLNDLYNRFDEQGKILNCEKIGTLGDCYYCVSGCPVPRNDHAICCVEMGLSICREILKFNKDHNISVDMRVGVHSGRVIAAIIGNQRFRFDVFSNDVLVANALETSGKPGYVHISDDTFNLVKFAYRFEDGKLLHIKKEEAHGISGFIQRSIPIKTYFVVPYNHRDEVGVPYNHRDEVGVPYNHLDDVGVPYNHRDEVGVPYNHLDDVGVPDNHRDEVGVPDNHRDEDGVPDNHRDEVGVPLLSLSGIEVNEHFDTGVEKKNSIDRLSIDETNKLFLKLSQSNNSNSIKHDKLEEDITLLNFLQQDPGRAFDFFQNPPMNSFSLTFNDKEIEHHYLYHTTDQVEIINVVSIKIGLLFDSIACLLYTSIILLSATIMIPNQFGFKLRSPIVCAIGCLLTIISAFISLIYKSEINNPILRSFYCFFSHPFSRLFISIGISSIPSLFAFSCYQNKLLFKDYQYSSSYFTLSLFGLIGNCLSTTSHSFIKHISTAILTILCILIYPIGQNYDNNDHGEPCSTEKKSIMSSQMNRLSCHFLFQFIQICLLMYYMTRENEKNIRINFYATREAEIRNAEASRAKIIAEELLFNIIPKHVFSDIIGSQWMSNKDMTLNYALSIPNAGIIFASVSNFFSKYYREDYKSGEAALKLLHHIICTFDNLLQKPAYQHLVKIKTINACYMIASGLDSGTGNKDDEEHLVTLMKYAIDMQYQMYLFNKKNIIFLKSGFTLKVGYNFGPVSAGIIGTSKPLYDVWGDTVNVASRMYSTAPPNHIQVADFVAEKLKDKFSFKYRGKVAIKGKGEMITYFVLLGYGLDQQSGGEIDDIL